MKINSFSFLRLCLCGSLLIFCIVVLESCSSTAATTLTGSWKDPEAAGYNNFMVVALTKKLPVRTMVEEDIARRLKREGVKGSKSLDVIPHTETVETQEDKKAAVDKIESLGHDAIITVTLVKKDEERRYVPGSTQYAPANVGVGSGYYNPATGANQGQGTYGAFGTYYMGAATLYNTPGYYEENKVYFLESNLYDVKTRKLVWSAQSKTFDGGDIGIASRDFSYVMVEAMKKENLIDTKKKK